MNGYRFAADLGKIGMTGILGPDGLASTTGRRKLIQEEKSCPMRTLNRTTYRIC